MIRSPPLRFVVLLLAGWTGARAVWLAPGWRTVTAEGSGAPRPGGPAARRRGSPNAAVVGRPPRPAPVAATPAKGLADSAPVPRALRARSQASASGEPPWPTLGWQLAPRERIERRRSLPAGAGAATPHGRTPSRWSFAAWSFLRRGDSAALAPGGTLGGSQAGALARFRLNGDPARPLALAIRLSSPVRRPAGAEAALGIDWRPSRRVPLHLLAERREGLGREGRSAFGLTIHGGVNDAPFAGLRVGAYAQAGIVGARSLDLFGDGALRLSVPLGERARLGAGAWAAAQPGLSRLDLGPQASIRLPLAGRSVTVAADWRLRAAGNARPGSGPTLTVATDF